MIVSKRIQIIKKDFPMWKSFFAGKKNANPTNVKFAIYLGCNP
ncbi:unknown [Clostridium sp. CAG:1013]|nr:unknown [Clostridium sp. CAG:1013]